MSSKWRTVPGACAALLAIVLGLFSIDRVDANARIPAEQLGYNGPTVQITAVQGDNFVGTDTLARLVTSYLGESRNSVAYTRWYDSGIVTIDDSYERFQNSEGPLARTLDSGTTETPVAVSSNLHLTPDALSDTLNIEGNDATAFKADVMFQDRYPVVVTTAAIQPFRDGIYMFAGHQTDLDAIIDMFGRSGLSIVDAYYDEGTTIGASFQRAILSPYGGIIAVFAGAILLCQTVVARMYLVGRHRRYDVAVMLGASNRDIWRLLGSDIAPSIALGVVVGVAVNGLMLVTTAGLSAADDGTRLAAVAGSGLVAAAMSAGAMALVLHGQARRLNAARTL